MKQFKLHPFVNSFLLIAVLAFLGIHLYSSSKNEKKFFYVNNVKLFNEFKMTKDLTKESDLVLMKEGVVLDSLYKKYQMQAALKIKPKGFVTLQKTLQQKNSNFQQLKAKIVEESNQQIWLRLNEYIKDYGKRNNIDILYGTQGNGTIMYAKEDLDLTLKIVDYANTKYQGL